MVRPAQRGFPALRRFFYGATVYWGVNLLLLGAELRWHIFYRLTVWDITTLRALAAAVGRHLTF